MEREDVIVVFQDNKIRRVWYEDEWYFSIIDIVETLTLSSRPRKYWSELKIKLINEGFEVSDIIGQLKLKASDGKMRFTDCASTKNMFRIIQSIPSKKAEPFKQWLAQVGYDRVKEIEDPELAQQRTRKLYKAKGYSDSWIEKRMRGIAVRDELVNEWSNRGANNPRDFAILTAEISKATFGMTPSEYKSFKNLNKENLRDHMGDLELIFSMLGEQVSKEITKNEDSSGFEKLQNDSKRGGKVAGNAREETENEIGRKVSSKDNYLEITEKEKRKLT